MNFRSITVGVALAIFGLGAAVGIGLAANSISGDSVGLSAEPLSPGDTLAPPAADDTARARARARAERRRAERRRAARRRAARRERQAASPPSTTPAAPPTTTDELEPGDDNSGRGSSDDSSGRGSDDSGSDDSGGGSDDSSGQRLRRLRRRLGRLTARALPAGDAPYVEHNYCGQRQSRGGGAARRTMTTSPLAPKRGAL